MEELIGEKQVSGWAKPRFGYDWNRSNGIPSFSQRRRPFYNFNFNFFFRWQINNCGIHVNGDCDSNVATGDRYLLLMSYIQNVIIVYNGV